MLFLEMDFFLQHFLPVNSIMPLAKRSAVDSTQWQNPICFKALTRPARKEQVKTVRTGYGEEALAAQLGMRNAAHWTHVGPHVCP